MNKLILTSVIALLACTAVKAQTKWTATWATAIEAPLAESDMPKTTLAGNTLRQVIHVSIGGEKLRLQLSNEKSQQPVEIKSVYIADTGGGKEISPKTATYLTFNGNRSVTIEPGKAVYTDVARYSLKPLQRLSVTITYGKVPEKATTHRGSRTTSYLAAGEVAPTAAFTSVETFEHWYSISALEVEAPASTRCIACLGNSITDGRGTTTDAQNRWTDVLAEQLGGKVAVINLGIGGNCVISGGLSAPASERFDRDILAQQGVTDLVIFEGVNDIGGIGDDGANTVRMLTKFYTLFAKKAKEKGMRVYGGTIMPFKNSSFYSDTHEKARQAVNKWIRTADVYDGVIDFDKATLDPQDPEALQKNLQSDWLHPNPDGYKVMGECAASVVKNEE
jgi:lysophospholipase L1-like esterase